MLEEVRITDVLPGSPERIYRAWLDPEEHSAFTGGAATVEARVGGRHTAWDGYIEGRILELSPGRRIIESWRTSEFPEGAADSRLEVSFDPEGSTHTRLTLVHTDIPTGQGRQYEEGWVEHYLEPMRAYFAALAAGGDSTAVEEEFELMEDAAPPAPVQKAPAANAKKPAAKKPAVKKQVAAKAKAKGKKPVAKKKPAAKAKAKKPAAKKKQPVVKAKKKPAAKAKKKPAAKAKKKPQRRK
jgi:uncharacterized protein YndB with AHSA1/START domain